MQVQFTRLYHLGQAFKQLPFRLLFYFIRVFGWWSFTLFKLYEWMFYFHLLLNILLYGRMFFISMISVSTLARPWQEFLPVYYFLPFFEFCKYNSSLWMEMVFLASYVLRLSLFYISFIKFIFKAQLFTCPKTGLF